jgi:hypothetical protein
VSREIEVHARPLAIALRSTRAVLGVLGDAYARDDRIFGLSGQCRRSHVVHEQRDLRQLLCSTAVRTAVGKQQRSVCSSALARGSCSRETAWPSERSRNCHAAVWYRSSLSGAETGREGHRRHTGARQAPRRSDRADGTLPPRSKPTPVAEYATDPVGVRRGERHADGRGPRSADGGTCPSVFPLLPDDDANRVPLPEPSKVLEPSYAS